MSCPAATESPAPSRVLARWSGRPQQEWAVPRQKLLAEVPAAPLAPEEAAAVVQASRVVLLAPRPFPEPVSCREEERGWFRPELPAALWVARLARSPASVARP